jgi:ATP-dependent RNA circularization protein (DNA/RNA ligase family)
VKDLFFKFPSTPHLAVLGNVEIRNDKVMSDSDRDAFLQHEIIIEEKVDGANLGISFDSEGNIRAQNRGEYLQFPEIGQWEKLENWLDKRADDIFEYLTDRYILFGEWCYAQHSIYYDRLPDWFIGFDLYDRQSQRFLSTKIRDGFLKAINISSVPTTARGHFSLQDIKNKLSTSKFSDQPAEGLYLRFDMGDYLIKRAKLVNPAFIQSIKDHWSTAGIKPNRIA